MNFDWSDNYNSGVPEIDIQHQRFLHLIKNIYLEKDDKKVKSLLSELYRYATFHFVSEEELMLMYSYSDIDGQKQSHQELLFDLSAFVNPIQGINFNKEEFIYFLVKWFVNHTTQEDKELGCFINSVRSA